MADEINNPRAAAEFNRLVAALEGSVEASERNIARASDVTARQERILEKQARPARTRASRPAIPGSPLHLGGVADEEDLARVRRRAVGDLDVERRYLERLRDYNDPRIERERQLGLERAKRVAEARQQAQILQQTTRPVIPGSAAGMWGVELPPAGYRAGGGRAPEAEAFVQNQAAQRSIRNADRVAAAWRAVQNAQLGAGGAGGGGGARPPVAAAAGDPDDWMRPLQESMRARVDAGAAVRDQITELDQRQQNTLARGATQAAAAQGGLNARMQESARVIGLSSDAYRRHGALTTEFITAAARGQTDIRELGFQAGATAAKFAGWTAAAAGVYGLLGAVVTLGSGALQGFDAVNNLQRIITNLDTTAAHQSLRDLSAEFNLPIGQVGEAAYGMSKVFQDQNETFEATRQALFAVKVGELDAGQATQYLNAIVKGFKLEASELPDVFDSINEAQNRFGGNVGQIVAGVARAGNAFRNTGANYRDLIAMIQTGSLTTGRPGLEIATGLQRSAEMILRPERRTRIIDLLGLDPQDVSIVELYERAMQVVARSSKAEAAEIARALSTPELATGRILPILQAGPRFQQIRDAIQKDRAEGSAARELERALRGPSEELQQLVVNFQRLGDALASSGLVAGVGGLLRGTNEVLDTSVGLVEVWGRMPEPIRDTLALFTQMVAVMAIMRRFDVGSAIGGRFPTAGRLLARRPESVERAQIRQGLADERAMLDERRRDASRQMGLLGMQADRAETRRDDVFRQRDQGLDPTGRRALAAQEDYENTQRSFVTAKQQQVDLADQQAVTQRRINNFEERVRRGMSAREAALAEGVLFSSGTLRRPSPTQPVPFNQQVVPRTTQLVETASGRQREVGQFIDEQPRRVFAAGPIGGGADLTEEITGREREFTRNANTLRRASEDTRRSMQRMGVTSNAAAATIGRLGAPMVFATRGLANVGTGLGRFSRSLAAQIGPLEGIFLGILAAYETYNYINQGWEKHEQQMKVLHAPGDLRTIRGRANRELDQRSLMDRIRGGAAGAINFVSPFGDIQGVDDMEDAQARVNLEEAAFVEKRQRGGQFLYQNQIRQRLQRRLQRARTEAEEDRAIERARTELANSFAFRGGAFAGPGAKAAAKQTGELIKREVAALKLSHGDIQGALREVQTLTDLESLTTSLTQNVKLFGLRRGDARAAGRIRAEAYSLLATAKSPEERQQAIAAIEEAEGAIMQAAQQRMDRLIKSGVSPDVARGGYLRTMRRTLVDGLQNRMKRITDRTQDRVKEIQQLERAVADSAKAIDPRESRQGGFQDLLFDFSEFGGPDRPGRPSSGGLISALALPPAVLGKSDVANAKTAKALRAAQATDRKRLKLLREGLKLARQEMAMIEQEQAESQDDLQQTLAEARTNLAAARTGNPMQQTAIQLAGVRERLGAAREAASGSLEDELEIVQLMTQEAQLQQQQTQNWLSRQQAYDALFVSRGRTEEAREKRQLTVARRNIARLRRLGDAVDPTQLIQAETEYNNLLFQRRQEREQEQESLLDALEARALSRTDDPVRQARIRFRFARRQQRQADTPEERIRAQARVNNERRSLRQTIQQEKFDNITFDADIERIDRETELARLRRLLKSIRGNRELRRTIMRRIHQLKQEMDSDATSSELDVGNIRLPTIYEIRRAIAGGRGDRSTNVYVTQHNRNDFSVARTADLGEVGAALEQNLGSGVKAGMRAAGL